MSIPKFRPISWISLIPQLIIMGLIMMIWYQFEKSNFILFGAMTYLIISQVLKRVIPKEHRKGIVKLNQEQFENAIPYFERSYTFFQKNEWVDKYRYVTLLSSAKISFREMALMNIAFCYGQIGKGKLAKEYYERTLKEFPNSSMAKVSLKFLNSMSNSEEE